MVKKRTMPVMRKQFLQEPRVLRDLKLKINIEGRELILHGDKILEQVENYPVWVEVGNVICRLL